MINLPKLQSIIAPLATPAAPAVLLANEIYRVMIDVNIPFWLAIGTATIALLGIESGGALMCHNGVRAWQRKSYGLMWVAIAGALVYAAIVWAGIATMPEARARILGTLVFLTLVGYAAYAIYSAVEDSEREAAAGSARRIDEMKAERLLTNAQTRQIKAGGLLSNRPIEQNGQIEHPKTPAITPLGRRIIDELEANGPPSESRSLRDIARAVGNCSPSTIKTWHEKWEKMKNDSN